MGVPRPHRAIFRFYEELNDFLSPKRRKREFEYSFSGRPTVKDLIESLGVPHVEVDLVLVNGRSVDFGRHVQDGDRVSVYPVFEWLDISSLVRLRPRPLRKSRFILDVHLGKLAKSLRLLGFDVCYENHLEDPEIIRIAAKERRIILTRDRFLLKRKAVTRGYCVRSTDPDRQVPEILERFDLYSQVNPFSRCIECNGLLEAVAKDTVADRLQPRTARYCQDFFRCRDCDRIYWKGSHFRALERRAWKWVKTGSKSTGH